MCVVLLLQVKALRRRFEQLDSDSDGVLSRMDMCRMLETAAIYVTAEELDHITRR
jgi:Ca2+-binding EF-hand superfamily protein